MLTIFGFLRRTKTRINEVYLGLAAKRRTRVSIISKSIFGIDNEIFAIVVLN